MSGTDLTRRTFVDALIAALRDDGEAGPIEYDEQGFRLVLRGPPHRVRELEYHYRDCWTLTETERAAVVTWFARRRYGTTSRRPTRRS